MFGEIYHCSLGHSLERVRLANVRLLQLLDVGNDTSAQALDVLTILLSSLLLGMINILLDFSRLLLGSEAIPLFGG